MKVAATKIAEKMSRAAAGRIVSAAKARHVFVGQREELMKPVGRCILGELLAYYGRLGQLQTQKNSPVGDRNISDGGV